MDKVKQYQKDDLVTVTIEDIGNDGEGIGKVDGYTLFIKDAVIGDTVQAKIMKAKKSYAYARLEKVLAPSSFRAETRCMYARQCGGCQIQALSYEKQLLFKSNKVRNNLIRLGGFAVELIDRIMEPVVGMENPYYYRNKAQFPFGYDRDGNIITGFYAGRTHSIIANTDCALGVSENQTVLETVLSYMKQYRVRAYDEKKHSGLVRHVLIRKGFRSGQLMVCLVINGQKLPKEEKLIQELTKIEGMTSISISINTEHTNVIMGKTVRTIRGKDRIVDTLERYRIEEKNIEKFYMTGEQVTFHISPLSFYQVNPVQTEKLYSLALEYAGLTGRETVWDLYCGIGTISLFLAGYAKQVYGVEIIPQAIEDAKENARINGIYNAQFFVGKAEEVLPREYEKNGVYADVIVVDPPRKGCDEKCLETMLQMKPERIVYVSCDSATLARDLKILCAGGYELKRVRAVDQFPHTVHVETCVLLSHQQIDKYKTVDYTPDGSYMKDVNRHATYKEINEYVEEKYGFKLHSAFIAQVKRECGIEMGENYNLSKSDDYEPREVTPEKRAAIIDALKHFNMIE
ncbi:MAG: 23S rRNA (uracil(1939)-C(5))-methyltransferase RlmD [Clostridiales bacterium]|nr:23S rRNA (uracil(1939)-C(5))-methyltransferase RlmD [Clostridiales bacterium]